MPTTLNLGANLPVAFDWATNIFTDLIKQSRDFSSYDDPAEVKLPPGFRRDANGHPLDPFGIVVKAPLRTGDDGVYRLRFKGKAIVSALPSVITVQNQPMEGEWQVADLTILPEALHTQPDRKQPILMLRFDDLQGESVRDISLIQKSLIREDGTAPTFHPAWIAHLKRFKVIRFMNWMVNWLPLPEMNWADRPKKEQLTQAGNDAYGVEMVRGVAPEYIVELANELKCDVWVNIPPLATDNYVEGLANLLKAGLPINAKVYVEYGNEIWNEASWQRNANLRLAQEEIRRGGSNLNSDGETDLFVLEMRRYARRTKEIGDIFVRAFGVISRNARVRPVYCYQGVNPQETLMPGLEFLGNQYGSVVKAIWGISPKTGVGEGTIDKPPSEVTAEDLIRYMREELAVIVGGGANWESATPLLEHVAATAAWHNVAFAAYEGGIGIAQINNLNPSVVFDMMTNPETGWQIYSICTQYLQSWFSYGNGNLMCWFLAGITDWGGAAKTDSLRLLESLGWTDESDISGLTWNITEQNTFPIQALDHAIQRGSFEVTAGMFVPGRIDARRHTQREANWESSLRDSASQPSNDKLYLVNAPSAKQFTFQLVSEKNQNLATSTDIWINTVKITTVAIPQGVGNHTSSPFKATLRKGMNALKIHYGEHAKGAYHLEVK
ncbi:MAG: hypothetical protein H7246_01300 [Phycisphaerae bacterium]|nr:hypothetical protein [Saprospiraceae bacterium]